MYKNLLNQIMPWTPLLVIVASFIGWLFKNIWNKMRNLIIKIHAAHTRLDKTDDDVKKLTNELENFINTIQDNFSEKIAAIQSMMTNQFDRMSNSIEKIYALMIKRKE